MNAVTLDPLARRVARRHLRDGGVKVWTPDTAPEIHYLPGSRFSDVDIVKLLAPIVGEVLRVRFRPSITGEPRTAAWEAVLVSGTLLTGKLVVRAGVAETEVVSWAEIEIDPVVCRTSKEYQRRTHGLVGVDEDDEEEDEQAAPRR